MVREGEGGASLRQRSTSERVNNKMSRLRGIDTGRRRVWKWGGRMMESFFICLEKGENR